ncbi:MAG: transglutaminase domain-containing protein [Phycisphaerales bacterium]|nr:transglutaminase domain-containing protein [Phycisphaerales bacterium]
MLQHPIRVWRTLSAHPCLTVLLTAGAAGVFCFAWDMQEQRAIGRATRCLVAPDQPADLKVLALTEWVYASSRSTRNERYFLLPGMRATAWQILVEGGDCADKARLLVAMLASIGIPASPVMLFDSATGRASHTVVEAEYAPGLRMVVDPSFNLDFPRIGGGYHDVLSLRADPHAAEDRVRQARARAPWPAKVIFYRMGAAGYGNASAIHWNRNFFTRLVFATLHPFLSDGVFQLRRPALAENPAQLCGVLALLAGAVLAIVLRLVLRQPAARAVRMRREIVLFKPECEVPWVRGAARSRFAWVLAGGLALRLAWMAWVQPAPVSDFLHYQVLAEKLLDHHQFGFPAPTAFHPPLFPAFLAGVMLISRSTAALTLACVALSTLLIAVVHKLALRATRGDSRAAIIAATLCAANPAFVFFSPVLASEHLFAVLVGASLIIATGESTGAGVKPVLAGALLGLAALTLSEAVFYAPVVAAAVGMGELRLRKRVGCAAICGLAFVLTLAPWLLRNRMMVGEGVGLTTAGGIHLYLAHNPDGYGWRNLNETPLGGLDTATAHHVGARLAFDHIGNDPEHLLRNFVTGLVALLRPANYGLFWSTGWSPGAGAPPPRTGYPPVLYLLLSVGVVFYAALALLGTIGLWRLREQHVAGWRVLVGILIMHVLCYAGVFWGSGRYRYFMEAILCAGGGVALDAALRHASRRDVRRIERVGLLAPA